MEINIPQIKQKDINYAIECMEECIQKEAKEYGFRYPYFAPGGSYGKQWWQLDSALALAGYKWIDQSFAETALWNFIESQKENGRICLWGEDDLPQYVAGGDMLKQYKGVSSLPKIFDVAYHILQRTDDKKLETATYNMMKKYLDWWFDCRLDKNTGLITAVFEETFIPYLGRSGEYAPVDTNCEVYAGCYYTGLLAEKLGKNEDVNLLKDRGKKLKESINKYLWNDEKEAYYPYDINENKNIDCLMASTFFPLRLCIASKVQQEKLICLLKKQEHFNWNTIPLTSVSKKDKIFTVTKGEYQGNASWSGNVWTLINEMVIRGLSDCGENELASELAFKTLCAFKSNCSEFINPFDGSGHGVLKYAWTASQFIELIIEVIFGVSFCMEKKEIVLSPRLCGSLKNSRLTLENLQICSGVSLDIHIDNGTVTYEVSDDNIEVILREGK